MSVSSISAGLIVRNKKILMFRNEEEEAWDVPSVRPEKGEISAEAALRASEKFSQCDCEVTRYKRKLQLTLGSGNNWNPYLVELKGDPQRGEWVSKEEIKERKLVPHLEENKEKFMKKI
ncbi:MAG: hypothetical protein ABEJ87_05260 [Candidatus Nanohalobium sp.]